LTKKGSAQISMILAVLALAGCSKSGHPTGEPDIYLKCTGSIRVIGSSNYTAEGQEIAVHIRGSKISFSGNGLLFEDDIPICYRRPDGTAQDNAYYRFDSDSCGPQGTKDVRTNGSYNWVLGKLDLSHTSSGPLAYLAQGWFKCDRIERN